MPDRIHFIVSPVIASRCQLSIEKILNCVIGLLIFNTGRARDINNPGEKEPLNTANANEREKRTDTIVNNLATKFNVEFKGRYIVHGGIRYTLPFLFSVITRSSFLSGIYFSFFFPPSSSDARFCRPRFVFRPGAFARDSLKRIAFVDDTIVTDVITALVVVDIILFN